MVRQEIERLGDVGLVGGERADAIDHCLASIAELSDEVKNASVYLPPYDQRSYGEGIKGLSAKLEETRAAVAPKPKFSFKAGRKNASAISVQDAANLGPPPNTQASGYDTSNTSSVAPSQAPSPWPEAQHTKQLTGDAPQSSSPDEPRTSPNAVHRPSFSQQDKVSIHNLRSQHIILPSTAAHATSSGALTSLKSCIVDMSVPTHNRRPFASLTLSDIQHSLIICGDVDGPVHITNVERSTIVAACRQFRMHGSTACDIYLDCRSSPIIEDCSAIRFAPAPKMHTDKRHSDGGNKWDQVEDFKWLRAEPSPNWQILGEDARVSEETWVDVVPGTPTSGLAEILAAVGVSKT